MFKNLMFGVRAAGAGDGVLALPAVHDAREKPSSLGRSTVLQSGTGRRPSDSPIGSVRTLLSPRGQRPRPIRPLRTRRMTLKRCKSRVFWERVYVTFLSKEPFVCGEAAPCGRSHAGPENPAPPSKGPALRPLLVFGCRGSPPPPRLLAVSSAVEW